MNDHATQARILRLERESRRLKLLLGAFLVAAAALLAMGQAAPLDRVVRASRFELVDDAGRVRGAMGIDEEGASYVALMNAAGERGWKASVAGGGGAPPGSAVAPGASPEETFAALQECVSRKDLPGILVLQAPGDHERMREHWEELKTHPGKFAQAARSLGVAESELRGYDYAGYYTGMMAGLIREDSGEFEAMGHAVIITKEEDGDRCELLVGSKFDGFEEKLKLVRVDGRWYFTEMFD